MLSGNYSERAIVQLRAGDKAGALASMHRALDLQSVLFELDHASVPTRMNMADQYARLGAVHVAFAEDKAAPNQRMDHWREAVTAFRQASEFYQQLRAEGHLKSKQMAIDADRAESMRVRCERELHH